MSMATSAAGNESEATVAARTGEACVLVFCGNLVLRAKTTALRMVLLNQIHMQVIVPGTTATINRMVSCKTIIAGSLAFNITTPWYCSDVIHEGVITLQTSR